MYVLKRDMVYKLHRNWRPVVILLFWQDQPAVHSLIIILLYLWILLCCLFWFVFDVDLTKAETKTLMTKMKPQHLNHPWIWE